LAGFFGDENIMFRATRQDAKKIFLNSSNHLSL
jgi:hypothetical protein